MQGKFSLENSFDLIAAVVALAALLGVLHTFVVGKHYLIPTMILFWGVLFGNLARFGLQGSAWAKHILFWIFFVFTWHLFFAIFFTQKYREVLGDAWEYVGSVLFVLFAFLSVQYARRNRLFRNSRSES